MFIYIFTKDVLTASALFDLILRGRSTLVHQTAKVFG